MHGVRGRAQRKHNRNVRSRKNKRPQCSLRRLPLDPKGVHWWSRQVWFGHMDHASLTGSGGLRRIWSPATSGVRASPRAWQEFAMCAPYQTVFKRSFPGPTLRPITTHSAAFRRPSSERINEFARISGGLRVFLARSCFGEHPFVSDAVMRAS